MPGDVVELRDDVLFINGSAAQYESPQDVVESLGSGAGTAKGVKVTERVRGSTRAVQFLPEVPARRSFGPVVVPKDSYFFLGDNRDNSADSRYIGAVPRRLLIGRAHRILVSADIKGDWLPRLERVGTQIR